MPNGWRTINSLVHKIRLHGRREKGMAESFSRQKSRHAPQKEGGLKILCDLPPVWPRLVRPTNLMSRMDGKKTNTHTPELLLVVQKYCIPSLICIVPCFCFGVPTWWLMLVYSITVGFSPILYSWPYYVADYIGEPFHYHQEFLSLQPKFPPK